MLLSVLLCPSVWLTLNFTGVLWLFCMAKKMVVSDLQRVSQEEQSGLYYSSIAPSSGDL